MDARKDLGVVPSRCGNCLDFSCSQKAADFDDVILANALEISTFDTEKETRIVIGDCYASGMRVAHDFSHLRSEEIDEWRVACRLGLTPIRVNHGAAFDTQETY